MILEKELDERNGNWLARNTEKIIIRQGTYLRKLPSSSADCLPGLIGKLTALTFDTE